MPPRSSDQPLSPFLSLMMLRLACVILHVEVGIAAERLNHLSEDLLGLRGAFLGHHHLFGRLVLSLIGLAEGGRGDGACKSKSGGEQQVFRDHPQSTDPPLTLITSPVIKVARSEAAKSIGPAISSAVPTRLTGIGTRAPFRPFLVRSTDADMSVSTQPGATQLTRIFCGPSSLASPFTKLMM